MNQNTLIVKLSQWADPDSIKNIFLLCARKYLIFYHNIGYSYHMLLYARHLYEMELSNYFGDKKVKFRGGYLEIFFESEEDKVEFILRYM